MLNRQLMPALVLAAASPVLAQDLEVAFRNGVNLATTTTDQHGQAFTVVGLSGIVRISGDFYIAVMDNSNTLVFLTISLAADGSINSAVITSGFALSESRDFEDIALTGHNSVLLAEEGTPSICAYSLTDGALLQQLPTPPADLRVPPPPRGAPPATPHAPGLPYTPRQLRIRVPLALGQRGSPLDRQ